MRTFFLILLLVITCAAITPNYDLSLGLSALYTGASSITVDGETLETAGPLALRLSTFALYPFSFELKIEHFSSRFFITPSDFEKREIEHVAYFKPDVNVMLHLALDSGNEIVTMLKYKYRNITEGPSYINNSVVFNLGYRLIAELPKGYMTILPSVGIGTSFPETCFDYSLQLEFISEKMKPAGMCIDLSYELDDISLFTFIFYVGAYF